MPPPPYSSKGFGYFRLGFTLAEVLITLTIIGIIAALTVPTLMTKVQDQGFRSAFLKLYNVMLNAEKIAERDGVPFWEDKYGNILNNYFANTPNKLKDYFKATKSERGGISKYYYPNFVIVKGLNGNTPGIISDTSYNFTMQLDDGSIISFFGQSGYQNLVFIDVNGRKGPNVVGRDVYFLQKSYYESATRRDLSQNEKQLLPFGAPNTGDAWYQRTTDCYKDSIGLSCGYEILKNRNFKIPNTK